MNLTDHYREGEKRVIGLMKGELVGKIMTDFAALRAKTQRYLTDDNDENNKAKDTRKVPNNRKRIQPISSIEIYPYEAINIICKN